MDNGGIPTKAQAQSWKVNPKKARATKTLNSYEAWRQNTLNSDRRTSTSSVYSHDFKKVASKKKGESENKKEECMEGPLEDELTNLPLLPSKHSICSANTSITSPSKLEVFNVAGTLFLVDMKVAESYPDTLLGSERIHQYYIPSRGEYFLEHHKHVFPAVMRFYTNDQELMCPPCMPKQLFEDELKFYGLLPYLNSTKADLNNTLQPYTPSTRKEEILLLLEFPSYSWLATVYALFDLSVIILSTIMLVIESIPEVNKLPAFNHISWGIEIFVNVYFTFQTIILVFVYPKKSQYFKSMSNWIDIVSVLPFYCRLVANGYLDQVGGLRVLRLIRLLRILKLFRHSQGSQQMMEFLYHSIPEIILLILMWSMGVLVFGPLLFFIERDQRSFASAFSGMWFCVVTIGTVGYGDVVPTTDFGKIVAAFYTILNLTIMTIPISIIITKFNKTMKKVT